MQLLSQKIIIGLAILLFNAFAVAGQGNSFAKDSLHYQYTESIAGEFLGGLAAGALLGIAGGSIATFFTPTCDKDNLFCLPTDKEIFGVISGFTVGSAIGVYMVGHWSHFHGNILYAAGGSTVG